jgi:LPS-assembly protein
MRFACRAITRVVLALALAGPAHADPSATQQDNSEVLRKRFGEKPIVSSKEPVLLKADQMDYDQNNEIVVASGKVEVAQGDTILLADQLIYDHQHNRVEAHGNVSMLQPSGDVYFAQQVELQDNLKEGVIRHFKARLSDNSKFVANGAKKVDENVVELYKAVYTPCNCGENGDTSPPLWQLKADHAIIDTQEQKVRYENAYLDVFGNSVFYTPYFSHATPGADNHSGLLMPTFMQSQNLGTIYQQPVYYAISPDKDLTVTPVYQSTAGPMMIGEYRQMYNTGLMSLEGSLTDADKRNAQGNRLSGHELRGHYDAKGQFTLDEHYGWGFNLRRASDDTYLRLYNFSNDTLLTSRGYAEGVDFIEGYDRTYASVEALSFQGLTGQDNSRVIPTILPLVSFSHQSNPMAYNSRVTVDGNLMSLYRQDGSESRRASGTLGWKLPYITDDGQIIEFNTRMRTDVYYVHDVAQSNGQLYDGATGRAIPQASLNWRYPFIKQAGWGSLLLEPIGEVNISPDGGNPEKIPNEDSLFPEFTDTNLFSADRNPGYDRVESGLRASYGMRAQAQFMQDKYIDLLFGQHWRLDNDASFPYSNDLTDHGSDYVGKIGLSTQPLSVAYRFRMDKETLKQHRSEVNASLDVYPVTLSGTYLSIKRDPVLATKEVIEGNSSVNLTRHWSWVTSGTRDILLDQTDAIYTGVSYKDECANLLAMVGKDYTNIQDIEPSTTFWLKVSLRNLE